jgi:hypothetical protein
VQPFEQAVHGVGRIKSKCFEQGHLWQYGVGDRPAAPEDRGIPKTHIKAQNCPAPDLNQQRNPGTAELTPFHTVHQNDIGRRMIHLDQVKEALADIFIRMRLVRTTRF